MIGGAQGPLGTPRNLILALHRRGTKDITLITTTGYRGGVAAKEYGFPNAEDWVDHSIPWQQTDKEGYLLYGLHSRKGKRFTGAIRSRACSTSSHPATCPSKQGIPGARFRVPDHPRAGV